MTDIVVKLRDRIDIKVHSAVVCSQSDFFRTKVTSWLDKGTTESEFFKPSQNLLIGCRIEFELLDFRAGNTISSMERETKNHQHPVKI